MLLRFGVENHRSIREYQEISFVASKLRGTPEHLHEVPGLNEGVLPVLGLYGANASGKSNLLNAFYFMRHFVRNSHKDRSPGEATGRSPFLLDLQWKDKASTFDCDFLLDNVRHTFGFRIDDSSVIEEWLYSYPTGRRRVLYHRNTTDSDPFYFGKHLKGQNRVIASLTRPDSLFLSAAAQNNHAYIQQPYRFFTLRVHDTVRDSDLDLWLRYAVLDEAKRSPLVRMMQLADTGIVHLRDKADRRRQDKAPVSPGSLISQAQELLQRAGFNTDNTFSDSMNDFYERLSAIDPQFGHEGEAGTVFLDFDDESEGTKKMAGYLANTISALGMGTLIQIDELDASLHPLLAQKLIRLFTDRATNPKGAQLLFTTHDTNLLSSDLLRRDEIWFTEKDDKGATRVYPLTDFHTRPTDNLERGYLQGRFGAIPFLGDLDQFISDFRISDRSEDEAGPTNNSSGS